MLIQHEKQQLGLKCFLITFHDKNFKRQFFGPIPNKVQVTLKGVVKRSSEASPIPIIPIICGYRKVKRGKRVKRVERGKRVKKVEKVKRVKKVKRASFSGFS